jgi:LemA protein
MTGGLIALLVVGAILLVFILWAVAIYNGLIRTRNEIDNSWAQIDVQLKRRTDLIPNLVETVKGYATHERETLQHVIEARNMAVNAKSIDERMEAENMLTGALKSLFAVSEAYPDLKANTNFLALQEELTSTENKVAFARQFYNDRVLSYNNQRETFPSNIVAGMFNFQGKPYFEVIEPEQRQAPKVSF